MHNFLYFISHYRKKRKMSEEIQFWNPRQISHWAERIQLWGDFRDGAPPESLHVLRLLSAILPSSGWPLLSICYVPRTVPELLHALSLFLYSLPLLKTRWCSKSEKARLGKMGRNQILPDMALAWWYPHCPKLVISLQFQKWSSVNRAFIHSVFVEYFLGKLRL